MRSLPELSGTADSAQQELVFCSVPSRMQLSDATQLGSCTAARTVQTVLYRRAVTRCHRHCTDGAYLLLWEDEGCEGGRGGLADEEGSCGGPPGGGGGGTACPFSSRPAAQTTLSRQSGQESDNALDGRDARPTMCCLLHYYGLALPLMMVHSSWLRKIGSADSADNTMVILESSRLLEPDALLLWVPEFSLAAPSLPAARSLSLILLCIASKTSCLKSQCFHVHSSQS